MAPLKYLTTLSLALLSTNAFKIHYYTGADCHGEADGTVTVSLANNMCSTEYMGVASSAIVEREDGDNLNDAVFWSGADNCDISNAVAESNGGICVEFSGEGVGNEARSYEVISGQGGGARKVKAKKSLDATVSEFQGKLERREAVADDQTEDRPRAIWHGMEFEWDGATYKYHQIFNETFQGVPVAEWDDAVNVKNDAELPYATDEEIDSWRDADSSDNPQRRALMTLEARTFREDICRVAAVCTAVIYTAPAGLKRVGATGINRAATAWNNSPTRKSLWAFLNMPFVTQAVTVGGSGYFITIATKGSSAPTNCSTTGTTQGTLKDALNDALGGGDVDSLQMNITVGGRIYTVDIQAQPTNNHAAGQCGNVNPNP